MIVLSLFDGMSCGQISLKAAGFKVNKYYASEIDKFAIQQTQHNFPGTIQLGDILNWRNWNIDWSRVNLVLAGSPCQGFSFAGKGLNFEDPRSKLFFVFVDIYNHIKKLNPDVKFLLENVNMKKNHMKVISDYLGVFPVRINSNLISAQNRDRWYWSNIRTKYEGLFSDLYTDIPQPADKGIYLIDVLQNPEEVNRKYYLTEEQIIRGFQKAKGRQWESGSRMGNMDFPNDIRGKAKTLTVVQVLGGRETNHIIQVPILKTNGTYTIPRTGKSNCIDANYHKGLDAHQQRTGVFEGKIVLGDLIGKVRRLTPVECFRLQTISKDYEWIVSDSQIYKMLGNGWTIDAIVHILNFLK